MNMLLVIIALVVLLLLSICSNRLKKQYIVGGGRILPELTEYTYKHLWDKLTKEIFPDGRFDRIDKDKFKIYTDKNIVGISEAIINIYNRLENVSSNTPDPVDIYKCISYIPNTNYVRVFNQLYNNTILEWTVNRENINNTKEMPIILFFLLILWNQFNTPRYIDEDYPALSSFFGGNDIIIFIFTLDNMLDKKKVSSMRSEDLSIMWDLSRVLLGKDLDIESLGIVSTDTNNPLEIINNYNKDAKYLLNHGNKTYLVKNPYKKNLCKMLKRGDKLSKEMEKTNVNEEYWARLCCTKNRVRNTLRDL